MLPDPFCECFFPKKSVRMLGKTKDCPLDFHAWVVYSFLWWKRRYEEGVTAKKIAEFTGLQRSSTVRRALSRLQELGLATRRVGQWHALPQPVEPVNEIKHHKAGEWVHIVPPQPSKLWFARKTKPTKYKHSPSWGLYLPTKEAPLTLIQCGLLFLLNSHRMATYPMVRVKKRSHAQLARMLGVHQETVSLALLALERHELLAATPTYYELIKPDADKLSWFRDATKPSYVQAQERQQEAQAREDPKVEVLQQMLGGGIPVAMCVELADFCERNGIPMQDLRHHYQEVRVIHANNQVDGNYTEIKHCGFLLKKRLERVASQA